MNNQIKSSPEFRAEIEKLPRRRRLAVKMSLRGRKSACIAKVTGYKNSSTVLATVCNFKRRFIEKKCFHPEPNVESTLTPDALAAFIETLPPIQREVAHLRFVRNRRYDEIAAVTGAQIGTVGSQLYQAREILRARLGERDEK